MPVTVTVCGVAQFWGVNVSDAGETVPSRVLLLAIGIVTLAEGAFPSATVKLAVRPRSEVTRPWAGERTNNGVVGPVGFLSVTVID